MKASRTSLIVAGLTQAWGGIVMAQPGSMDGGAGAPQARQENLHGHHRGHMAERHSRHLAELKVKLQLEANQEAAWKTFVDAIQPPLARTARAKRTGMEKLTTPEHIDQMQSLRVQHDTDMRKREDAVKAFYAGLNDEQKKTFDAETARHMSRGQTARHHGPAGHH